MLVGFTVSAFATEIRLSDPVIQTASSETFGAVHNEKLPSVTLSQLLMDPDNYKGQSFQLETEIAKVCQKKGCFFIAREKQHVIRVAFKDYGFFIPTGSGGKQTLLTGMLVGKEISEKQAAHFNKDLNTKASIKAGLTYEIVADSVTLPKG